MSLVVEDGTGLPNAESYISVAAATTYFNLFYLSTDPLLAAWTAAVTNGANAEIALRRSTRDLDAIWGQSYWSSPSTSTQALLWPRVPFYEYNRGGGAYESPSGFYYIDTQNAILVTGIPEALGNAVAELALIFLNGTDVTGPLNRKGAESVDYMKVGGVLREKRFFHPSSEIALKTRKISALLAPFVNTDPFGSNVPLIRG